jgi:Flp pilus assembly protein protease CpaA
MQNIDLLGRIIFVLWSLFAGFEDYQHRIVPNWVIMVGFCLAVWIQVETIRGGAFSIVSVVIFSAVVVLSLFYWGMQWWGGADAKFLIVTTLAFPTFVFVLLQVMTQFVSALLNKKTKNKSFPAILAMAGAAAAYAIGTGIYQGWQAI